MLPPRPVGLSDAPTLDPQACRVVPWGEATLPWGEVTQLAVIPWGEVTKLLVKYKYLSTSSVT